MIENVGDLRQRAIHIHRHTLIQRFCLQGIQPKKQFIRVGGIHVFACVGESDPDTLHIVSADQFNANGIFPGGRQRHIGIYLRQGTIGVPPLYIVVLNKTAQTVLPIDCPNNLWVKVAPCRVCGGVNMLHDESSQ